MKKLLIVDVPEDGELRETSLKCFYSNKMIPTGICKYKELILPSEEEIEKQSKLYIRNVNADTKEGYFDGANWYRNEILKQLK